MTKSSNHKSLLGLTLLSLLVVFALGWWLGQRPVGSADAHDHGTTLVASVDEETGETVWTCSMHPQVRQPEPGSCPICGMDLIPAATDDDGADDSELPRLQVSARSAALMNVQTWPVERREVEREVRLLGRVNFDATRQRTITAWIPGRLDQLLVSVEGSTIAEGDPVAEIYSPALIAAQEELLQALATARGRGTEESAMVEAARERLGLLGLSAEQIGAVEERGSVQDRIVIRSPLAGVITRRTAVEGTYVQAGDPIAALAALDQVYVDFEAYERDLPWLVPGQTVRFTVEGLVGDGREGQIAQINPFVDPGRRTAQVRLLVDNADGQLKPGMFAQGVVASQLGGPEGLPEWREESPLVIPATAALVTGRRAVVYVKIPDTGRPTFELRQVALGPRAGDRFLVTDGLTEGELVVTNGNFKIDSELQLRGRPSMMSQPGHDHEAGDDHEETDTRQAPQRSDFADTVDPDFGEEIAALVGAYLELAEGLSSDDEAAARVGLTELRSELENIGEHRLTGEAHVSWMGHYATLTKLLAGLGEEPDMAGLRNRLQALTGEVERIYVDFGGDALPELQRAYCPMALEDRGASWLQTSQNIYNPYFGSSMLRCGEVLPWAGE